MPQRCHFGYRDLSQGLISFKHPGTSFKAGCVLVKTWTSWMCTVFFCRHSKGRWPWDGYLLEQVKAIILHFHQLWPGFKRRSDLKSIQCNPDTSYTINHHLQDTLAIVLTVTSRIATLNQNFCWQTESVWKQASNQDTCQALKLYVTFITSATKISTQSSQHSIELF